MSSTRIPTASFKPSRKLDVISVDANLQPKLVRNKEEPATGSRFMISALRRRSKSVADLRSAYSIKEKKPNTEAKENIVKSNIKTTTRPVLAGSKRAKEAINDVGPPKPKIKKIPDWDYKARFNQLNDKYGNAQQTIEKLKSKASELEEIDIKYTKLQLELKELQQNFNLLKENNIKLMGENEHLSKEIKRLTESLEHYVNLTEILTQSEKDAKIANKALQEQNEHLTIKDQELNEVLNNVNNKNDALEADNRLLRDNLAHFQAERRVLHNIIQDLKGTIRVFCRVRPPTTSSEMESLQCNIRFMDDTSLEIKKNQEIVNQITGKSQDFKAEFTFDRVFDPQSGQEDVFEDLAELIQSALDGYNVCVFAYGQTGSGKTYTMQGQGESCNQGMIPRTVDLIFNKITELERSGWKYSVQASFLEIYNENIRDLLNISGTKKLEILYNEGKGITVVNLITQPIESATELRKYINLAHKNRATAATDFNEHSSRSHAVTKIYLEGILESQNMKYKGSINLVDLAGSECAKTSLNHERLKETKNINKSLATLGDVIAALYNKSKHVPYRNSKLTYLLQSSLGGNSKTLMVVNIAPFESCFHESINSLRFAAKVKEVKMENKRNKLTVT